MLPHNWRVFKFAGIIFGGMLLLLTGCNSVYQGSEAQPPPREWSLTNEVVQPALVKRNPSKNLPPHSVVKTISAPAVHPISSPQKVSPPAPILTWTSLDRWAVENKLAAPRKISNSPVASYSISSHHGTMILEIGSREASWNGLTMHLGFAPEIIDDQIFVYGLDLQKNLEPLLLGNPLVFGTNRRVGPLDAALINGTAAHALDYDDCSNTLGGHPSAPVVPALFAVANMPR